MTVTPTQDLFPSFSFKNGWRPFSTDRTKTIGCWPNQLWAKPRGKSGRFGDHQAGAIRRVPDK